MIDPEDDEDFDLDGWLPRQEYVDAGYFVIVTEKRDGRQTQRAGVTPKGVAWLLQKYGPGGSIH